MRELSVSKGANLYGPSSGSGITLSQVAQSATGFGDFLSSTFSGIADLILATKGQPRQLPTQQQPNVIIQQPQNQNQNTLLLIGGGVLIVVLVLVLALRK